MRAVPCTISGTAYTLMPASLGALRDLTREGYLEAINDQKHPKFWDAVIAVLSACLSRAHPECTIKWVADNVDMIDMVGLYTDALKLSIPPQEGASPNAVSP